MEENNENRTSDAFTFKYIWVTADQNWSTKRHPCYVGSYTTLILLYLPHLLWVLNMIA